jgi:hypothetical protein
MEFKTKDEVQKAFQHLLALHQKSKVLILTKEEQAQEELNKKLVEESAKHQPSQIVKGLADLQLELGTTLETLAKKLQDEEEKYLNLQKAIAVQEDLYKKVINTKIAANALYILQQEQQQHKELLDKNHQEALKKIDQDIELMKNYWAKDDQNFKEFEAAQKAQLEKDRQHEIEEYKYKLERKYKIEQDDYSQRKKLLQRELQEQERKKQKDWSNREKVLAEQQSDFDKYKEKVDGFDAELENKVKEARDKAFKQASKEAKEEFELLEKEVEGKQKMADFQIQSLEQVIERQKSDLERLSTELKEALSQVQALSLKALESAKNK